MPQMSPMWWLLLMFISLTLMMFMISIIYFNFSEFSLNSKFINKKKFIWMW